MPRLLDCPECGLPAEILARFVFDGFPHPVEHVKLMCVAGHWFTLPVDSLAPMPLERVSAARR